MFFAACLLVTSTLPTPAPAPVVTTPSGPAVMADADQSQQTPQSQDPVGTPSSPTPPHRIGIGAQMNAGANGASGGTRYWFGDRIGIDFNAGVYRSSYIASNGNRPMTFVATPSLLVRLGTANATADMQVRPFVGAGISYSSTSQPLQVSATSQRLSGTGEQVFGGLELTFKEYDSLAISAEGIYRRLPTGALNVAQDIGGFDWVLALHYYIK